jgi:hypothetical protein
MAVLHSVNVTSEKAVFFDRLVFMMCVVYK